MKKYIFAITALAAMLASCSQDADLDIVENVAKAEAITTINVSSENVTRAVVSGTRINWVSGDKLGVLGTNASSAVKNEAYTLSSGEGTTNGTFTNNSSTITTISATMYPYQENASWDAGNNKLTLEIPTRQTGKNGSFDPKAAVMYAFGSSTGQSLSLAVNFLKVTIPDDVTNVHAISISSPSTALSGKMEVTSSGVTAASAGACKSVGITAGAKVENCFEAGDYYIAVKAGEIVTPSISYVYYDATNHKAVEKTKAATTNLTVADGKNVKTITADFSSGTVTTREAVQLWADGPYFATYNVGVTDGKPESYGGYYTWGGSTSQSSSDYKTEEVSGNLSSEDDTATKLWGSNWRMPTSDELKKLDNEEQIISGTNNCTIEWKTDYETSGIGNLFTGNSEGYTTCSVFLPAAGDCILGVVYRQGVEGHYWSSTPFGNNVAQYLYFDSGSAIVYNLNRDNGYSVRAVLAEN